MFLRVSVCILFMFIPQALLEYLYGQTAAWKPGEMYRDMLTLDRSNFSRSVLESEDVWIVLFHQGTLDRSWKTMAVDLRGIVWFGLVHQQDERDLLAEIGYKAEREPMARVYLHGLRPTKRWQSADDPYTARSLATRSLPDLTLGIRQTGIQVFVTDCLTATPTRFPVLLLTDEDKLSALWKALAYRLHRYFQFGYLARPTLDDVSELGLEEVPSERPGVLVLTTVHPTGPEPSFSAIPYSKSMQGEISYPNLLQFFLIINRDYRHLLYGNNLADVEDEALMASVLRMEAKRFDLQGVWKLPDEVQSDAKTEKLVYIQDTSSQFLKESDHDEL